MKLPTLGISFVWSAEHQAVELSGSHDGHDHTILVPARALVQLAGQALTPAEVLATAYRLRIPIETAALRAMAEPGAPELLTLSVEAIRAARL